jgi:SAM-dependent methyltransferase
MAAGREKCQDDFRMNLREWQTIKARQKATWESGDFGEVARYNMPSAVEFLDRLPLRPGLAVLDVACGTGNIALIAAERGCQACGVDIAANLIAQARERAREENVSAEFVEGDAEALPYPDQKFDAVVTMYGAMFAPRPEVVVAELLRVCRVNGFVAMANWTPEGFIGKMFEVFQAHLPPASPPLPSPLLWGDEPIARDRLRAFSEVRLARRIAVLQYPFPPAETVEFFRRYYGPTGRAFEMLAPGPQADLRRALVELQTTHNASANPMMTEVRAEYLEVIAVR